MFELSNNAKTALVAILGAGAWATISVALHRIAPQLSGDLQTIAEGFVALVLLGVGWLFWRAWASTKIQIAIADTVKATGDRLCIVIAAIANDEKNTVKERIQFSLRQELRDNVEILPADECIALGTHGGLDERERTAHTAGQELLNRRSADLLIWGSKLPDENTVALNFLVREVAPEFGDTKSYELSESLRLPADFSADLGSAIAAVAMSSISPAFEGGKYVVPLLRQIADRLRRFLSSAPSSLPKLTYREVLHSYAIALQAIGGQTGEASLLEEAASAYRMLLKWQAPPQSRTQQASTQNNLAMTLIKHGEREAGTARLEEGVLACRAALELLPKESAPLDWATVMNNLATALGRIGERDAGTERLREAVEVYRDILTVWTRQRVPLEWATVQNNLGAVLGILGKREKSVERYNEAAVAIRESLLERRRDRVPLQWATAQNNLGGILVELGALEENAQKFEEGIFAFREALKERLRDQVPLQWATSQCNLGTALVVVGSSESDPVLLREGIAALQGALEEFRAAGADHHARGAAENLGEAEAALAKLQSKKFG